MSGYEVHRMNLDKAAFIIIRQHKTVNVILDISGRTISDVVAQIIISERFRPSIYKRSFAVGAWANNVLRGTITINTDGTISYVNAGIVDSSVTTSISMTYVI